MQEVSNQNFQKLYPKVEKCLKNASLIAIDGEFTGIHSNDSKYSLFDSIQERYTKLKNNVEPFIMIQFGITTFHHNIDSNSYKANCFSFYLFPRSMLIDKKQFSWQITAVEFLSTCNFDFNKVAYEGIPYINECDEAVLWDQLKSANFKFNEGSLSYEEKVIFYECKSKVVEYFKQYPNELTLKIPTVSPILQYAVHKELRELNYIWTMLGEESVIATKVTEEMRSVLERNEGNVINENMADFYMGFFKVFKLLTSLKKPIIGHNVMLDLLFIHQQFYKPLPNDYHSFKRNIHTLFPCIYDTKVLINEARNELDKEEYKEVCGLNSLASIYYYFESGAGRYLCMNAPNIILEGESQGEVSFHNAGWDSYCTGYIFIKAAQLFCVKKFGKGLQHRPLTQQELENSVKCCKNKINLARSNDICMILDGCEPEKKKPEWLHVKFKSPFVNLTEVGKQFSLFGSIDVMPFARKRVLVAVFNRNSTSRILAHFKNNEEFQVARFHPIMHAHPNKVMLWSGIALSSGLCVWILHRAFKKYVQV